MFFPPLLQVAQRAAVVVAIIMALIPAQTLVCRHCLLHDIVSLAAECSSQAHAHHHEALHADCSESDGHEHPDDKHGSHQDCPCCVGGVDHGILMSSNATQIVQVAAAYLLPKQTEQQWSSSLRVARLNVRATLDRSSLPNVLRI